VEHQGRLYHALCCLSEYALPPVSSKLRRARCLHGISFHHRDRTDFRRVIDDLGWQDRSLNRYGHGNTLPVTSCLASSRSGRPAREHGGGGSTASDQTVRNRGQPDEMGLRLLYHFLSLRLSNTVSDARKGQGRVYSTKSLGCEGRDVNVASAGRLREGRDLY